MMGTKMTKLKSKLKSGLSPTVQCQWYVIMFPALVVKPNRVHQLFSRVLAYFFFFHPDPWPCSGMAKKVAEKYHGGALALDESRAAPLRSGRAGAPQRGRGNGGKVLR